MSVDTKIAVYPGTFDPITNGHVDILERSVALFDEVVVAIVVNPRKSPLFSVEERKELIKKSIPKNTTSVRIASFGGLLVDFCESHNATCIVRGLRAIADFEYEFQLAHMNRRLSPKLDSVFFMTDEKNHYVSSSIVKEVAQFGGDVSGLVPTHVEKALKDKFKP